MIPSIWVDTDCALGAAKGDVDDGYALAAVLAATEATSQVEVSEMLGVSVVSGNTDAETALDCVKKMLEVGGSAKPVVKQSEAAEQIAAVPDGTAILALGPLSNIAGALRVDPRLLERTSIRIVATVVGRWRHPILPRFCLNSKRDPAAADAVFLAARASASSSAGQLQEGPPLNSSPPAQLGLRVLPLDIVQRLRVGKRELEELAGKGTLAAYLAEESWRWLRQAPWRYQSRSFPVWDLVAALDALDLLVSARSRGHAHKTELIDFDPRSTWSGFAELVADRPAARI